MRSLIRYIAALIAITAVFVSLLYVACEAVHDCEGGNCPVCAQVSFCRTSLKASPDKAIAVTSVPAAAPRASERTADFQFVLDLITPVSLKIKLLN